MKCTFIRVKMKDKRIININDYTILELSIGNKKNTLNYNKYKKEFSSQNLDINIYKKYIKKNIGKMIYKKIENSKDKKYLMKYLY